MLHVNLSFGSRTLIGAFVSLVSIVCFPIEIIRRDLIVDFADDFAHHVVAELPFASQDPKIFIAATVEGMARVDNAVVVVVCAGDCVVWHIRCMWPVIFVEND